MMHDQAEQLRVLMGKAEVTEAVSTPVEVDYRKVWEGLKEKLRAEARQIDEEFGLYGGSRLHELVDRMEREEEIARCVQVVVSAQEAKP